MSEAYKIAFIDIETAPNLGYTWGKYEQTVLAYEQERYMLSFSVKWAGDERARVYGLPDYPNWQTSKVDDSALVRALWRVLDEADLVVAHNGDKFDLRVTNARFLYHGLTPPTPYKTVDTLKIARKHFMLNSNKLDDLATLLGLGHKLDTGGIGLWLACMEGDLKAWRKMKAYNKHDVILLEQVYDRLKTWHTAHPRVNPSGGDSLCTVCGSGELQTRGWSYTARFRKRRYLCVACGHWMVGKLERLETVQTAQEP